MALTWESKQFNESVIQAATELLLEPTQENLEAYKRATKIALKWKAFAGKEPNSSPHRFFKALQDDLSYLSKDNSLDGSRFEATTLDYLKSIGLLSN